MILGKPRVRAKWCPMKCSCSFLDKEQWVQEFARKFVCFQKDEENIAKFVFFSKSPAPYLPCHHAVKDSSVMQEKTFENK